MRARLLACASLAVLAAGQSASAQTLAALTVPEQVVVYGTLPNSDIGVSADKVPGTLQSLSASELMASHGASVLDALGSNVAGVSLSNNQGNSMSEDVRFHGFEASPLQGTPQGIAVYQGGVRVNEAFGDTVNWDAIPQTAISRLDLWSANPVYGLNALGGAVNIVMKNGFTAPEGGTASVQGGSFGHVQGSWEYGERDGGQSLYYAVEGVRDSGWRLRSGSGLVRMYGDAGWKFGDSEIHVVLSGSQSQLGVVGPTPIELTQLYSKSVYTWPQISQNRTGSLAVNGKSKLGDDWQIEGNAYLRNFRQRHIDGNDGNFEKCSGSSSFGTSLCLQDDAFGTPAGGKTQAFRNQFAIITQTGNTIPFTTGANYGTVDRTNVDTTAQGGTVQLTGKSPLGAMGNNFTAGASIDHSNIGFRSVSILAREFPDLDIAVDPTLTGTGNVIRTMGNLGYAPTDLGATTDYYGFYAVDALDLTDALTLTAGFRFNIADINTRDRSGTAAELNGSHNFNHFNPLAGLTYKVMDEITLFGGYSQANRAPTPLELDCASPTQPCLLEGALVADPPLAQVTSETFEAGLRGAWQGITYSASLFRTDSSNDIVSLASVIQGRGYFANVPLTRRQGADITARYEGDGWSVHASYSYLDANYQFSGTIASANNPVADANGNVQVTAGRHIPLNPQNQFRLGGEATILPGLNVGADLAYTGSQYFDGDFSNVNAKLSDYWTTNLRAGYDVTDTWQVYGVVNNLFDQHNPTYGTYFSAPDVPAGLITPALTDNRSITLPQPISFQFGVKARF